MSHCTAQGQRATSSNYAVGRRPPSRRRLRRRPTAAQAAAAARPAASACAGGVEGGGGRRVGSGLARRWGCDVARGDALRPTRLVACGLSGAPRVRWWQYGGAIHVTEAC